MIKKIFFTFFLVLGQTVVFGQAVGDYRSNVTIPGIWATSGSWETYNGTTWVSATNYPGEISGTYSVLIQFGDVITIDNTGISTQPMGTVTINGALNLTGINTGGSGTDYFFNTNTMIVATGFSPSASINFQDKVNLKLPTNAVLQVSTGGLTGQCSNNQNIYIGLAIIAYCVGGQVVDFTDLMNSGGTLNTTISSNTSPVCETDTISLLGGISNTGWTIGSYSWSITSPSGAIIIPSTQNVSIPNALSGTYTANLTVTANYAGSSNYSNTETVYVIVNSKPTAPTIGTITQPTCALPTTGSVVLSGLPAGNWTLTRSGTSSATTIGTGTSTTISGLAVGTYAYTISNGTCTSAVSSNVVINPLVTNTWNGAAWSTGSSPTADQNIVFAAFALINSNIVACSCQANADVTVNSPYSITLTNGLTVTAGNTVFKSGSSLVQINNVSNSGDIKYERDTFSRNTDYTYWSSPVLSFQTLGGIEGLFPDSLDGTFYSFDSSINPANWKNEPSGTSMTVGKGYIARGPEDSGNQTPPNTPFTTTFSGVPNNGTINVPILHSGASDGTSNLIGNPYPSAINADLFLAANSTVIEGTLYFWTHNTEIGVGTIELGSGLYPYTGNDYASYNGTGGAAGSGGKIPTGKIAAGQGFFATSYLANGIATFTNAMRLAGTTLSDGKGVNQQFFKKRNAKTEKIIEKNRIWLNLTNTQGSFKQTLVGYITDATNDYDSRFDGESFDGNEFVDFYSVNQDKNLVIQGRALPFDENDEVPLGYRTTIKGAFSINIDQADGLLANQAVFIEDKLTNTITDLKSGNYTFNTVAGTFNDRFVLRYKNNSTAKTLAAAKFDALENKVLVSSKNKQIKINSFTETIEKVTIYDLQGRQIYQKDKVNSSEFSIANLVSSRQVLVVKTVLQNGVTVTDKIIY